MEVNSNSKEDLPGNECATVKRVSVARVSKRKLYYFEKRIFDTVLSVLALIVLLPLFTMVALIIKAEDPKGTVFYSQIRIGRNGRKFKMFKFRSMITNADQQLESLMKFNEVDGAMFKISNDPRVTKIGKFIRKYSIDELPQLLNVVIGDMALVGPRPPLEREIVRYSKYDFQRLLVTPGCTGLWQTSARNSVGFHEMVELDLEYISKSGFFYDLGLMFKTVYIMIKPNNAY